MIKFVIDHRAGLRAGVMLTHAEIELVQASSRFFAERLLSSKQQSALSLVITVTATPRQAALDPQTLVGTAGLFSFVPPCDFAISVSSAAGMRAAFLHIATQMVTLAQVATRRLCVVAQKRQVSGARKQVLRARWKSGRAVDFSALQPDQRPWMIEAMTLAQHLVDEFLAWSVGEVQTLPKQARTRGHIGLHAVEPAPTIMPNRIIPLARQVKASLPEPAASPVRAVMENAHHFPSLAAGSDTEREDSASTVATAHRGQAETAEFSIYVVVPNLGKTRRLDGAVLEDKLNDLLARGLIERTVAKDALRLAGQRSTMARQRSSSA